MAQKETMADTYFYCNSCKKVKDSNFIQQLSSFTKVIQSFSIGILLGWLSFHKSASSSFIVSSIKKSLKSLVIVMVFFLLFFHENPGDHEFSHCKASRDKITYMSGLSWRAANWSSILGNFLMRRNINVLQTKKKWIKLRCQLTPQEVEVEYKEIRLFL